MLKQQSKSYVVLSKTVMMAHHKTSRNFQRLFSITNHHSKRKYNMNISSNSNVQCLDEFFDKKVYLNPDTCFTLKENPVYDYSDFSETDLEPLKLYEETILKQSNRIDELSTEELDELIGLFDKVFKKNDFDNYELRYLPLGKKLTELEYRARRKKLSDFINEKVDLTVDKTLLQVHSSFRNQASQLDDYSKYSVFYMNILMRNPSFGDHNLSREKLINFVNMVVANPEFYFLHNPMFLFDYDSWLLLLFERIKTQWLEEYGKLKENEFDIITDPQTNQSITLSNTLFVIRAICTIGDKELFEKIVEECMKRDPHNVYIPFLAAYSYYLKVVESSMYADNELEMDQNHFEWCSKGIEYCKKGLDIFSSIPKDSLPQQNPNLKYHTEDLLKDRPIVNRPDLKLFPFNFSFILSILHSEMAILTNSDPDTKKFHVDQAMLYSQPNVYVKGFVKNFISSYGVALYASGDYEKAIQVLEKLEFKKKTSDLWYESIIMCQAMIHLGQFDKCTQFIDSLHGGNKLSNNRLGVMRAYCHEIMSKTN